MVLNVWQEWRVPHVEQELLTLLEHMSSPPVFSGVRVARSLVLYVCFVDRCLSFFIWPLCCLFIVDLRILITLLVIFLVFYAMLCRSLFVILLLVIVLSVLLFTSSDCAFGKGVCIVRASVLLVCFTFMLYSCVVFGFCSSPDLGSCEVTLPKGSCEVLSKLLILVKWCDHSSVFHMWVKCQPSHIIVQKRK
jgi:hypothetical protein